MMGLGLQELAALAIVAAVVAFALYRRLRRQAPKAGCHAPPRAKAKADEQTIHFYRRDDR